MSQSVTHIAGPTITVEGRFVRQRCSWCGEGLVDDDLARMSVVLTPGQEPSAPKGYEVGRLVRVEGNNPRVSIVLDDERLPDDACALAEPPR